MTALLSDPEVPGKDGSQGSKGTGQSHGGYGALAKDM